MKKKMIYRNLESNTLKLERDKSHLMFNETCYNNDILPTYIKNLKISKDRLCFKSYMFSIYSTSDKGFVWVHPMEHYKMLCSYHHCEELFDFMD